jgi:hypothetical protein
MIVSSVAFVMLLSEEFFRTFTKLVHKAIAAGGGLPFTVATAGPPSPLDPNSRPAGQRGLRTFILSAVLSRSSEGEAHEKVHSFIVGAAGA